VADTPRERKDNHRPAVCRLTLRHKILKSRIQLNNKSFAIGRNATAAREGGRARTSECPLDLKGASALYRRKFLCLVAAGVVAAALNAVSGTALAAGSLTGAGSTLVAPIEAEWAQAFAARTGATVTYNPVGSGTGITDISNRLVDFGASDAPMTSSQAAGCHGCYMIPWALSATGVGFHISGVGRLHLTGSVLAAIYLGQIRTWNSSRIRALNHGVHLPNLRITPVFRTDGSGDTYAFTNYLSDVSGQWRHRVGFATSVGFPAGVGGKGNSGVTQILQSTNGSIAYVAVSYLIAHGQRAAAIKNASGRYEYPNLANIESAAKTVKHVPSSNALHIVNPPKSARIAYPISTFTYAIVPASTPNAGLLKSFIRYALGPGQSFGPRLDFAPIPGVVIRAAKNTVNRIS
jgi:phosphate transport system substrate-binding protein